MTVRSTLYVLATASFLLVAPSCKKKEPASSGAGSGSVVAAAAVVGSGDTPGSAAPAGSAAAPAGATLTDPQIAAIVVAANQVDIDAGQLAIKKAKNPEVKAFAQRMVTDHSAVNKSAVDLVTKLKVTPEETDTSKSLVSGGAETRAKLEKLDGDAFDRAYVDNEVAYHQAVIGVLGSQLIPAATNPELKAALVGVQPAFDAHLEHAKKIQQALAGGGGSATGGSAHEHKM